MENLTLKKHRNIPRINYFFLLIVMLTSILCITLVSGEIDILLSHTTPNNAQAGTTYGTHGYAQGFNLTDTNYIYKIGVIGFRTGFPGTCFMDLRAGDEPTGPVLSFATFDMDTITSTSAPGEMINFTFDTPYEVTGGVNYSFHVGCNDGVTGTDFFTHRLDNTNAYLGGYKWYSGDNGTTWSVGAEDLLFEIYGSVAPPADASINISLISPGDNSGLSSIGTNFTVNYTVTIHNLTNATYYIWDSTGIFNNTEVVLINGSSNSTNRYIDNFTLGNYEWNVYACHGNATWSNCSFAPNNYTFTVGASIDTESFNNYTYETAAENFITNLTLLAGTNFYDAELIYNGTTYPGTITDLGSAYYSIQRILDVPRVLNASSLNFDWYWKLTYEKPDGSFIFQNLTTYTQNAKNITIGNCSATLSNQTLNFTSWFEVNETMSEIYDFYGTFEYWIGTGTVRNNFSITSMGGITQLVCLDRANATYYTDAKIQYERTGYVKRSYYLINATLTNTSQDVGLYLLDTGFSTSFIISVIDNAQRVIKDAYIYIQRYYPGSGLFHTIQLVRTDEEGSTVAQFEEETEDYKFIVQKEGVILYQSEMQKIYCKETPCTIQLQTDASAPESWNDFGNLPNLIWNLEFNEATDIWTYTYVDTSGTTSYGRLLVYTKDGINKNIICNKNDTSSAATITCNCSGQEGTVYAEVYLSRSPEIFVYMKSIVMSTIKGILGLAGLFWSMMIIMVAGFIGIAVSATMGIILLIAGVVLIGITGLASFGTVFVFGIILIGIIFLWELRR